MIKDHKKQKGMALVTVMLFAAIVLVTTAAIFLRITHASKELTRRERMDKSVALTDAVLSNVINWLNVKNFNEKGLAEKEEDKDYTNRNVGIEINGLYFIASLYDPTPARAHMMEPTNNKNITISNEPLAQNKPSVYIQDGISKPNAIDSLDLVNLRNTAFNTLDSMKLAPETLVSPSESMLSYLSVSANTNLPFLWKNKIDFFDNYMGSNNSITKVLKTNTSSGITLSGLTEMEKTLTWKHKQIANSMFRQFRVTSNNFSQVVRLSIIPITTNVNNGFSEDTLHGCSGSNPCDKSKVMDHTDIFKVIALSCYPDCNTATPLFKRTHELIIQRPVRTKTSVNFDHAVLANGSIDIKNADTNAGVTYLDSTNQGDVHSNQNIAIGPNGNINGKVTSSQLVYFGTPSNVPTDEAASNVVPITGIPATGHPLSTTTQIGGDPTIVYDPPDPDRVSRNKLNSKSKAEPIPLPALKFGTMPTTECVLTDTVIKDCVISTASGYSQMKTQQFAGTVYIKGDYTQKGDFIATGNTGVRIIVDGVIDIGGNAKASSTSNQSVMFVSNSPLDPAVKIHGNPGTGSENGAVFYTSKPTSTVRITGTSDVFGAILASGQVNFDGNMTMKRDTDLSSILATFPPSQDECKIQIVSWKELRE